MPFNPASGNRYDAVVDFGEASPRPLPEGWSWYSMPAYYGPGDCDPGQLNMVVNSRTPYETALGRLKALRDWAIQHDLWVEFSGGKMLQGKPVKNYCRINPSIRFDRNAEDALLLMVNPYRRGDSNTIYGLRDMIDPFLTEWEGLPLTCAACGGEMHSVGWLTEGTDSGITPEGVEAGSRWLGCRSCFSTCQHRPLVNETEAQAEANARLLGRPRRGTITRQVRGAYCGALCAAGQRLCSEHTDPYTCAGCNGAFDRNWGFSITNPENENTYCEVCYSRLCCRCFGDRGTSRYTLDDHYACRDCYTAANQLRIEIVDRDVRMTADDLLIPALPDRPVRFMSIEQEFEGVNGNEGHHVATDLLRAGLSCYGERMRYHSGDHAYPAHVERDSSVESGGELIYNRLDLADPVDAQNMASICDIVKTRVEAGNITFTAKCGTHTHIDLHGYTIPDARNYVTIYSYLEDVIFRLGAAGYGDHRSVVSKSGYAVPIRKDKWGNLVEFGVEFLRNANHTDSLNMQHFYNSLKACECGAIEFGNLADCTCNRPKCTAEWRVFNGTGNSKHLHAWAAFVQAMTAWCQNRELDLDLYEPLGFEQGIDFTKPLTAAHRNLIEAWKPRLEWVWENLPLTDGEKSSLVYCIEHSPLKHVGPEFIASLDTIVRVEEERELLVPRVASRFGSDDPEQVRSELAEDAAAWTEPEDWDDEEPSDF